MSQNLDITKVSCFGSQGQGNGVGYGMVTFNNAITVKFNIMKSGKGELFVSWPSRKKATSDEYVNFITFEDQDIRNSVQNSIIDEFNKVVLGSGGSKQPAKSATSTAPAPKAKPTSSVMWGKNR